MLISSFLLSVTAIFTVLLAIASDRRIALYDAVGADGLYGLGTLCNMHEGTGENLSKKCVSIAFSGIMRRSWIY
jgi:hypothetical protein